MENRPSTQDKNGIRLMTDEELAAHLEQVDYPTGEQEVAGDE